MIAQSAFKTRCYPNQEQEQFLFKCCIAANWAYNFGLQTWQDLYAQGIKTSAFDIEKLWTQQKKKEEYRWISEEVPAGVTGRAINKHLDRAFKNFFTRVKKGGTPGYPKFKDKYSKLSAEFKNGEIKSAHIAGNKVRLPKLNTYLRIGDTPKFTKLNCTTISFDGVDWWISFQIEGEKRQSIAKNDLIGVDVGVKCFAVTSEGEHLPNTGVNYDIKIKRLEVGIENLQRSLKHKTYKASNGRQCFNKSHNVEKVRKQIATKSAKLRKLRTDRVHKTTSYLVKNWNRVAVEDLNVKGMTASAKGDAENPGSNVAAKAGLNRAMLRQGIGEFFRVLEYKLNWSAGQLIAVNPAYTSQTCPCCGHVSKANRPTRDRFECEECGFTAHADHVGAMNIANRAAVLQKSTSS